MNTIEIDPELGINLIELSVATLELDRFEILQKNYDIQSLIDEISTKMRSVYTIEKIKDNPVISQYRNFYWKKLKVDPTKIRPASEALIRRILKNREIPKISPFVDAYNWASIISLIPMGGYDLDKINLPIKIRMTAENEIFHPIGKDSHVLPEKTLVTSDNTGKILCQYPYRDSQLSMVTTKTSRILLIAYGVEGISQELLTSALETTKEHLNFLKKNGIIKYHPKDILFFGNKRKII
ncbi:hypothetical protein NEF87_005059 [Candidatus Lokiarchaeum ossiferum]|uniref:B3/B4 tRNA-binding domain-containing protein n=1 Tax=Candidatus Lokiarchaeum ossiferum TaxID=2951803 RepID=A0ABY6HZ29_9ARCH|nr:hypothetical protein NEF87_005059 [Candidatus Lokiarchaeum sp. B-35]